MGNKGSKVPAKGPGARDKASTAKRKQHMSKNQALKNASRQLSCMSRDKRTKREKEMKEDERAGDAEKGHELAEHLRQITPFNGRWSVSKTINEGTYGVVFDAFDEKTKVQGVIKVAKSMSAGNQTTEWESFLLERIFREDNDASIARILDRGMLADQDGNGMEFVVLEKAQILIREWLDSAVNKQLVVLDVAIQMLKGIADLHYLGLLHRDLKPDNMGIYSKETPVCLLFDLGMARMYTDGVGGNRAPRTVVPFRGTPEWASGHAAKGREQSRFDDLIAWLYVTVELMDPNSETNQPLPWTYRFQQKPVAILKSNYAPARLLLRYCPLPFYAIYSYLMSANRLKPPDYAFIADRIVESKQIVKDKPPPPPRFPTAAAVKTEVPQA
ncbi:unnamed protein product [Bursaphelenchus xylophilus]|uniref:(pine wood nematode) hypothetical protein n=1 Tax=Bursaphelenchus xylophilus TaxID=6326 RepID=A0A1I7SCV3_BURXY|nr:unnamed protein product [Bursaphelenchus xylophilus]CAG9093424.1 unnamed protein product [Bursaphelenchus xylophilus]